MTRDQTGRAGSLGARLDELLESSDELCAGDEQRREPLIERARSRGLDRELAERAYDLAVDEGLPPAYGIAIAAAGISVQPLESPPPDVQAAEPTEPGWVDRPPPAKEAAREWRLRQTFRRVRSFLPDSATPRDTFAALASEPDLEPYDYA
jgi:hypothetical protein